MKKEVYEIKIPIKKLFLTFYGYKNKFRGQ